MTDELSDDLQRLDDFLLSKAVGFDAMLLSELDGYLAGLLVGPDMIMPGEWLPRVWGDEEPVFDDQQHAQHVLSLIMLHYNRILGDLSKGAYRPIYDHDRDDSVLWETWIEGFWAAIHLRPASWLSLAESTDDDVRRAMFGLTRLHALAITPSDRLKPLEIDDDLRKLAPDLIPDAVGTLHGARTARRSGPGAAGTRKQPKTGRNDPCPCGSGRKHKHCCLDRR